MSREIPNPVVAVVAEVLGEHYYSHSKLNTLFMEAGAPGEPPEGNCVQKCLSWLKRTNATPSVEPLKVLGGVLLQLMETGWGATVYQRDEVEARQTRVRKVLSRCGFAYHEGGIVLAGGEALPVADLNDALRKRDFPALDLEFKRALASLESDPPSAVTAACSLLESLFKIILEEKGLPLPTKRSVKPLWQAVQRALQLDMASLPDDDMRRIISGLTSVVDGVGALRTHAGSAHGHGQATYSLSPRQSRLAVHAAHTLCLFAFETWEEASEGSRPAAG